MLIKSIDKTISNFFEPHMRKKKNL